MLRSRIHAELIARDVPSLRRMTANWFAHGANFGKLFAQSSELNAASIAASAAHSACGLLQPGEDLLDQVQVFKIDLARPTSRCVTTIGFTHSRIIMEMVCAFVGSKEAVLMRPPPHPALRKVRRSRPLNGGSGSTQKNVPLPIDGQPAFRKGDTRRIAYLWYIAGWAGGSGAQRR
jgi:hypothetical protein